MTHHTSSLDLSRLHQQQQQPAPGSGKASGDEPQAMTPEQREKAWRAVYRDEHSDFKGKLPDGTQTLMAWAKYGGGLVSLTTITDAELAERFAAISRRAGGR